MIVPLTYKCDTCGAERTETNHWFAVQVELHGIYVFTWKQATEANRLERSHHFCGKTHALQFVSSEMGTKEGK